MEKDGKMHFGGILFHPYMLRRHSIVCKISYKRLRRCRKFPSNPPTTTHTIFNAVCQ